MASPRKAVSATNTAASSAANFFQRGKKATTTHRVIANKNNAVLPTTSSPNKKPTSTTQKQDQDENEGSDEDRNVDDSWSEFDREVLQELLLETAIRSPKKKELHRPVNSSSSHSHSHNRQDHLAMKPLARLFSEVTTPPTIPRKQSRARATIQTGVHQDNLSKEERTLRQFDLASMYGPSLDLTRLERWERAFSLGLDPPQNIKDLLLKHTALNTSLFTGRV